MWLISCIGHKGRIKRRRPRRPIPYQRINSIDDGRSLMSTRSGASSRRNTTQSITVCLALVRAPYLDICPLPDICPRHTTVPVSLMKKMIIIHFYCCVTQRTFFWEIDGQRNYRKVQTVFFTYGTSPLLTLGFGVV